MVTQNILKLLDEIISYLDIGETTYAKLHQKICNIEAEIESENMKNGYNDKCLEELMPKDMPSDEIINKILDGAELYPQQSNEPWNRNQKVKFIKEYLYKNITLW